MVINKIKQMFGMTGMLRKIRSDNYYVIKDNKRTKKIKTRKFFLLGNKHITIKKWRM